MKNASLLKDNIDLLLKNSSKIRKFLNNLFDSQSMVETDMFLNGNSIIEGSTSLGEGVVTGYATINEIPVNFFADNCEVLKGSFGIQKSKKIINSLKRAKKSGTPFVGIIDCSGFRINEDIEAMEGYSALIKELSVDTEIPLICIVKGKCLGLINILANMFDFVFVSSDCISSINSPMKLAKGSEKYTELFGKSFNFKTGLADFSYANEKDLKEQLYKLLMFTEDIDTDCNDDPNRTSLSLNKNINSENLFKSIFDNGEYCSYKNDFAPYVKCVLGRVNGFKCAAINLSSEKEYIDYKSLKKINAFVKVINKFTIPMITFVDSKGLDTTLEEEESGIGDICSELLNRISQSTMPKISVICNKAIGYAYSAFASKGIGYDYVLAFCDSVISPINSEAAIYLYFEEEIKKNSNSDKIKEELIAKYNKTIANPFEKAKDGYIDNIIEPCALRPYIAQALLMILGV